jgi:hypothetical protein
LIATFPALAVNDVWLNFSCPLGSAANVSTFPAVVTGAAAELEAAELEVDVAAEADAERELLLLDPPHAASPSINTTGVSERARSLDTQSPFKPWPGQAGRMNCRTARADPVNRTPEQPQSFPGLQHQAEPRCQPARSALAAEPS